MQRSRRLLLKEQVVTIPAELGGWREPSTDTILAMCGITEIRWETEQIGRRIVQSSHVVVIDFAK